MKPVLSLENLNYSDIARKTGVTVGYVSRIYRGMRVPSAKTLRVLARERGVSMDVLMRKLEAVRKERAVDDARSREQKRLGIVVSTVQVTVGRIE